MSKNPMLRNAPRRTKKEVDALLASIFDLADTKGMTSMDCELVRQDIARFYGKKLKSCDGCGRLVSACACRSDDG